MGLKRQVAEAQQQRDTALEQIQQAASQQQPESAAGHMPDTAAEQEPDVPLADSAVAVLQQHADAEAVLSQQVHLKMHYQVAAWTWTFGLRVGV